MGLLSQRSCHNENHSVLNLFGLPMIGQFSFSDDAPASHIALELAWRDGYASGRIIAPGSVVEDLAEQLAMRPQDEFISLPIALGYSIIVAMTAGVPLTLTGDRSVWPEDLGALQSQVQEIRSH